MDNSFYNLSATSVANKSNDFFQAFQTKSGSSSSMLALDQEIYQNFENSFEEMSIFVNNSIIIPSKEKDNFLKRTEYESVAIFSLLIFFCLATVLGNLIVILAVVREHYLHSPTNYFIVSLASSDFLLGIMVMPFEAITELLNKKWIFGSVWCDLWRALDVLLATASILNLCVISLDRYWAISSPFSYPRKMTPKTSVILIAGVWIISSALSFPFIFYWRYKRDGPSPDGQCFFTDDIYYIVISSCLSFYIPLFVMLYFYFKIYRAAVRQMRSIKMGCKFLQDKDREVQLRIHRGGNGNALNEEKKRASISGWSGGNVTSGKVTLPFSNSVILEEQRALRPSLPEIITKKVVIIDNIKVPIRDRNMSVSESASVSMSGVGVASSSMLNAVNAAVFPALKLNMKPSSRGSILKKKFTKFAKEKRAAKTLAIVLGVFILCWLPFFVINLVAGFCPSCGFQESVIFNIVTWLGWVNSSMNPLIYAVRNREFRRFILLILLYSILYGPYSMGL